MRIASNKKTMTCLAVLFIVVLVCSHIFFDDDAKASEAKRIVDTLNKEGMMLGVNGLPWGTRVDEYFDKTRLQWEYKSVWGFWKEYLSNTETTEGYLQLECRRDIVGGLIDFDESMVDGFAVNAVWNSYNVTGTTLLTDKVSGELEGINLVFMLYDTESNIDTFIEELGSLLGEGSISYHKTKIQEQWTFPNITCTLKAERSPGFIMASVRIINNEAAGIPFGFVNIDTTGKVFTIN